MSNIKINTITEFVKRINETFHQFGNYAENKTLLLYNLPSRLRGGERVNRLRQLREERGMKQAELATALKTTPQSVSRYENGDRGMDYEVIDHLCNLFDCTADYLLGRSSIREQAVSEEDAELIRAYHAADLHVQAAIKTLLAPHIQVQENKQAEVS